MVPSSRRRLSAPLLGGRTAAAFVLLTLVSAGTTFAALSGKDMVARLLLAQSTTYSCYYSDGSPATMPAGTSCSMATCSFSDASGKVMYCSSMGGGGSMSYSGGSYSYYSDPREQWIMNCMSTQSLGRPECMSKCDVPGSGCPSGSTGGHYGGSMHNCTYPNATKNGTTFTAFCEGDYYNCKDKNTGVAVSNDGLSLGAPSSCESGWTGGGGGSYSAGGGWYSSYSGGGGSNTSAAKTPLQMCQEGCGSDTACYDRYCKHMEGGSGGFWSSSSSSSSSPMTGGSTSASQCYVECTKSRSPAECTTTCYGGGPGYGSSSSSAGWSDGMTNCTYNAAMMNGASVREPVICERPYVNCRMKSTGILMTTAGLSLGEPSQCNAWSASSSMSPAQCFAECTKGISGSDPRYAACTSTCYGGGPGYGSSSSSTGTGPGGRSDMTNCKYYGATWKRGNTLGKPEGSFSSKEWIFCTSDYGGCRLEPAGTAIPDAWNSLQLGIPSICNDKVWTGGRGSTACEDGCRRSQETAMTSPTCRGSATSGVSAWCTDTVDECIARCRTGGETGGHCGPDSEFGRKTRGLSASDPRYKEYERQYGCGSPGGGGTSGESCRRGCENMASEQKTSPVCRDKNPPPWCTQTLASCFAGCDTTGGGGGGKTGSCVDGCRSMTGVQCTSATGDTEYWCKHWKTGTCEQACKEREGGSSTSRSSSSGRKVLCCPSCDPESAKRGMCPMAACIDMDPANAPPSYDCGGGGAIDPWTRENLRRTIEDFRSQAEQMRRAQEQAQVNVDTMIADLLKLTAEAISCVDKAQRPEDLSACDAKVPHLSELAAKIWTMIRQSGKNRQLDEWIRGGKVEKMEAEVERWRTRGGTGPLEYILKDIRAILDKIQKQIKEGASPPEIQSSWNLVYSLETGFWKTAEAARTAERPDDEYRRGVGESCDAIRRKLSHFAAQPAVAAQLESLLQRCLKHASDLSEEEADRADETAGDLLEQFDDIVEREVTAKSACTDAEEYLENARQGLAGEVPEIIAQLKARKSPIAGKMDALFTLGRTILGRIQERVRANDCSSALQAVESLEEDVRGRMEALLAMSSGEEQLQLRVVDYDRKYEEIGEQIAAEGAGDAEDVVEALKTKGYAAQDILVLKQVDPRLLVDYLSHVTKLPGSDLIQIAAKAGMGTSAIESLLEAKTEIARQYAELKEEAKTLKKGILALLEQVSSYTFNPALKKEVSAFLEKAPKMSAQEIQKISQELISKSKALNVRDGITPFSDVDPFGGQEWVVGHLKEAVQMGLIKGVDGKHFEPQLPAKVAEVVTVFGRMAGVSGNAKPRSVLGKRMPAWAQDAAATVEELLKQEGLSLDEIFKDKGPADPATREQVALLLTGILGKKLPAASDDVLAHYSDLKRISRNARAAIARGVAAGIMKGAGDLFGPERTFNRAEFAVVVGRTLQFTKKQETKEEAAPPPAAPAEGGKEASSEPAAQASSAASSSAALPFDLEAATEKDVRIMQAIIGASNAKYTKIDILSSRRSDIAKTLSQAYSSLSASPDPHDTVNLRNWLITEEPFKLLQSILFEQQTKQSSST